MLPAAIIVKCIGSQPSAKTERVLGKTLMSSTGLVERGLWAQSEPRIDIGLDATAARVHGPCFDASLFCAVATRYWREPRRATEALRAVAPHARIGAIALSERLQSYRHLSRADDAVGLALRARIESAQQRFGGGAFLPVLPLGSDTDSIERGLPTLPTSTTGSPS